MTRRDFLAGCSLAAVAGGCATTAPLDNPVLVRPGVAADCENPVLVAPGEPTGETYAEVWDRVYDVLDDYFPILPTGRESGKIKTLPRIAPGYEQIWKPGSPDPRERLLATFQTIRHFAEVDIWPGERGGYRVYVEVYKELEDLERPAKASLGDAVFQEAPTVDRQFDVIGPEATADRRWIRVGRDFALEQAILRKIQQRGGCR